MAGIVGSSHERAKAKAEAENLPEPYESFEAMLADERVDVVHLATPNHLHDAQVREVLAAGKHVVCEKPLAMNSTQTGELLELAQASGKVHAVNFNQRFYAQNLHARAAIAAGELGDVRLVSGGFLQDWLLYDTDWSWRLEREQGGDLRVVGDIGSHWLDLMSFVTGHRVEAVMADLTTFMPVRKQPVGQVETFSDSAPQETVDRADRHRGRRRPARALRGRRARRGDALAGQRRAQEPPALGDRRLAGGRRLARGGPGGAVARPPRPPNELLLREQELPHSRLPPGHAEGFAETFRELYRSVYTAVAQGAPPERAGLPDLRRRATSRR